MKQMITAQLKLVPTADQKIALKAISEAYRDACNYASKVAFELDKTTNANLLHKNIYEQIRGIYNIPSQIACSVSRYTTASYKALWSKAKSNKKARKLGYTKKLYKGLEHPPKFKQATVNYQYHYDYTFKKNQQVSVMTLDGRTTIPYFGWNHHIDLIKDSSTHIGGSKLWYDKTSKTYYLLVSMEVELPDTTQTNHKNIVGVDLGQRYLAVATDTSNHTFFASGKQVVHRVHKIQKIKKSLIKKLKINKKNRLGTRSVSRRLSSVSKRERRHKQSINHAISKQIINRFPNSVIGLEDLSNIRERTNRRHSKKSSNKQRKSNKKQSSWAFAEMQSYIGYKTVLNNSMTVKVDAHYTSKMCPKCGHVDDKNRPNKGLLFICQNCGFTLHADLIGSRNIALRALLIRQDWMSTGCLSTSPSSSEAARDASDVETKAECLKKYSELRWSPEAKIESLF